MIEPHPELPASFDGDAELLALRLAGELDAGGRISRSGDALKVQWLIRVAVARAFAHGQLVQLHLAQGKRTCLVCGCWELCACVDGEGQPCAWIGPNLCTACMPPAPIPAQPKEPAGV